MLGDLLSKFGLVNITGTITAALGSFLGIMDYFGCKPLEGFQATCQLPGWFPVAWVPAAIFATGGAALIMKLLRPGTVIRNLFGGTAVIVTEKQAAAMPTDNGVVTPDQVAATSAKTGKK
jgi:hypothetical protein